MKRRFQIGNDYYDIPDTMVSDFLKDNPHATEVKFYQIGNDKYNIPLDKTDEFESDMGLKKRRFNPFTSFTSYFGRWYKRWPFGFRSPIYRRKSGI